MELSTTEITLIIMVGGLIGSMITLLIQQSQQNKREFVKIASTLALTDYTARKEFALKDGGKVIPVECYFIYHYSFIKMVRSKSNVTATDIKNLKEFHHTLLKDAYDY